MPDGRGRGVPWSALPWPPQQSPTVSALLRTVSFQSVFPGGCLVVVVAWMAFAYYLSFPGFDSFYIGVTLRELSVTFDVVHVFVNKEVS